MKLSRLALALLLALSLSPAGAADKAEPVTEPATPGAELQQAIPQSGVSLEDIQTFVAVYRAVKDAYVEPVDDKVLMQSAIRGLLT
ncbi:MAG TPA: peptidase S41, partial [Xanthomonadales bacterium]|nr:peptidase S41 [Xanthomonadales bacterium]